MKDFIAYSFIVLGIYSTMMYFINTNDNDKIQIACEFGYFEGQKDALDNDIRIMKNHDSSYIWSKSPWDNKLTPKYNPLKSLDEQ